MDNENRRKEAQHLIDDLCQVGLPVLARLHGATPELVQAQKTLCRICESNRAQTKDPSTIAVAVMAIVMVLDAYHHSAPVAPEFRPNATAPVDENTN